MSVVITLTNVSAQMHGADAQAVSIVYDCLSYDDDAELKNGRQQLGLWNSKKSFLRLPEMVFEAGFVPLVRRTLAERGIPVSVVDHRTPITPAGGRIDENYLEGITLYDFQVGAGEALLRELRGVVRAATGAGKTEIACLVTKAIGAPTLFLTHQLDLVRQARNRYHARLGRPVGMISEGEWMPSDITVATVQTINAHWTKIWRVEGAKKVNVAKPGALRPRYALQHAVAEARGLTEHEAMKYARKILKFDSIDGISLLRDEDEKVKAFLASVQLLIVDEAHRCAADMFFRTCAHCVNAYYRLGLTATPLMRGKREDDLKLIASTGDVIYNVTNKMLIDRGILAQPYFRFVEVPKFGWSTKKAKERIRAKIALEKPGLTKEEIAKLKIHPGATYQDAYEHGVVFNQVRNELVVEYAKKLVDEGRKTVVLVQRKDHGKLLEDMLSAAGVRCQWVSGEDDVTVREAALKMLREGALQALVASTILDEGLDEPSISGIVMAGGGKSKIKVFQRVGRSVRQKRGEELDKLGNTAKIVDFIDTGHPDLMKHSAHRFKTVDSEEGWIVEGIDMWADREKRMQPSFAFTF